MTASGKASKCPVELCLSIAKIQSIPIAVVIPSHESYGRATGLLFSHAFAVVLFF
jgi:hypothetical protein